MSVRRLPDGSGFVIRWLPSGKAGPYRQETLRGATFAEAKRAHAKKVAAGGRHVGRRALVKELWARYSAIELPKRAPGWRSRVEGFFERLLIPRFGELRADVLTTAHLVRYRHERELDHVRGDARMPLVKAATIDKEVSGLLALLNFAAGEGLIERNPIPPRALRRERRPAVPQNFFTTEEWQTFTAAFDDEKAWERDREKVRKLGPVLQRPGKTARRFGGGRRPESKESHEHRERLRASMPLFRWLLVSGSRVGEGIALRWKGVDLVRGLVTIYQEKTKCAKVLPLSTEARRVLKAQGRGLPDALVFPRPSGGPWEHAKLWRTFKAALALVGGRGVLRIHDLRHTAGSWLAQEGFSEAVIAEILGHKRGGVTAGYVHLKPEHLRAAVEKLGVLSAGDARVTRAGVENAE